MMVRLAAFVLAWSLAAGGALAEGRWQQVENQPNCAVWNDNPQPKETVTWTGDCVNGRAEGHGKKTWRFLDNGTWKEDLYTGDMRSGKSHGRGVFIAASGGRYDGEWKDGKSHGHGRLTDRFGVYEGDIRNNKKHGQGVYVWASGGRYEGGFEAGRMHGRGVKLWANGDSYDGEWKNGRKHGRGVKKWANGDRYEGLNRDDQKHGHGVFIFRNGDRCEGDWQGGRLLGMGKARVGGKVRQCYLMGGTIQFTD